MSPWLYQVRHPLHWLMFGQNAVVLQAICALIGLALLWRYTVYIRRMMTLGEMSRRASITPVFTAKEIVPHYVGDSSTDICRISMTIRNIGQGPAAIFWSWHQPVSDTFSPSKNEILLQSPSVRLGYVPESDLMRGDSMEIHFDAYNSDAPTSEAEQPWQMCSYPLNRRWLFVIDSIDQAGGRHQLQMLREAGKDGVIDVKMVHALGETLGERLTNHFRRTIDILLSLKREILRLFR